MQPQCRKPHAVVAGCGKESDTHSAEAVQDSGPQRAATQFSACAPLPLTCTPPVASHRSLGSSACVSPLTWMRPGCEVLSMREAVLTVSPAAECGVAGGWRVAAGGGRCGGLAKRGRIPLINKEIRQWVANVSVSLYRVCV